MPGGLFTDFYELTMAAGYHAEGMHELPATFDLFFRDEPHAVDIAIAAGLEQVIGYVTDWSFTDEDLDYLRSLGQFTDAFLDELASVRFTGDVCGVAEGTPVFPNEPVVRVQAPLLQAQLLETALINRVAHSSLIASHAAQVVAAANGKSVLEFGARRAHGPDGALTGSRAAMIGGCASTSLTEAGQHTGAPVSGTQAHSWIMAFEDELASFRAYARTFPDACVLLVDTYDTLRSGVPNAITVARELREDGHELSGIRLDSGDLARLAHEARSALDDAGFPDVRVLASGDLNAARIDELEDVGAPIDAYGVGTELATARPDPSFNAVYKLAEIDGRPTLKVSSTPAKTTDPGVKQVWRTPDSDVVGLADEDPGEIASSMETGGARTGGSDEAGRWRPLLQPVVSGGQRTVDPEPLESLAARCREERAQLVGRGWKVRRSPRLQALRTELMRRPAS